MAHFLNQNPRSRRPEKTWLAQALGVSVRTLWNWQHLHPQSLGRPRASAKAKIVARILVLQQLESQGWSAGWRPIAKNLKGRVGTRAVQEHMAALKKQHRAHARTHRQSNRKSFAALARGALSRQDATQVGRHNKRAIQSDLIHDAATRQYQHLSTGPELTSQDVIQTLEDVRLTHGLPLVHMTDNGSAYCSHLVHDYFNRHQVIHLKNRPHTATDNAGMERAIRDAKDESNLDSDTRLDHPRQAHENMSQALQRLNQARLRRCLSYRTPNQAASQMPPWYTRTSRQAFFLAAQRAMAKARSSAPTPRKARQAEREAVFTLMASLGLATYTRGGVPLASVKPEELL